MAHTLGNPNVTRMYMIAHYPEIIFPVGNMLGIVEQIEEDFEINLTADKGTVLECKGCGQEFTVKNNAQLLLSHAEACQKLHAVREG